MELEPTLGSTVRLRLFEPLVITVSVDEWQLARFPGKEPELELWTNISHGDDWRPVPMLCQDAIRSETKGRLTVGRCVLFPAPGSWEITARVRFIVVGDTNREPEFMWAGGFGKNLAIEVKEVVLNSPRAHVPLRDHGRPHTDEPQPLGKLRPSPVTRSGSCSSSRPPLSTVIASTGGLRPVSPPLPPGFPRTSSSESSETPLASPKFATALLDSCFHYLWAHYPPKSRVHCELLYTSSLLASILLPGAPDSALMPSLAAQRLLPDRALDIRDIPAFQFVFDTVNELLLGLTALHTTANRAKVLRLAVPCSDAEALKILANVGSAHTVLPVSGSSMHVPHAHHGDTSTSWPVSKLWQRGGCGNCSRPSTPIHGHRPSEHRRSHSPAPAMDAPDLTVDELNIVRLSVLGIARWACQPHRQSTEFSRSPHASLLDGEVIAKSASTGSINSNASSGRGHGYGVGHSTSASAVASSSPQTNSPSVAVALELLSGCVRECPLTWLSSALVFYLVDCLCHSTKASLIRVFTGRLLRVLIVRSTGSASTPGAADIVHSVSMAICESVYQHVHTIQAAQLRGIKREVVNEEERPADMTSLLELVGEMCAKHPPSTIPRLPSPFRESAVTSALHKMKPKAVHTPRAQLSVGSPHASSLVVQTSPRSPSPHPVYSYTPVGVEEAVLSPGSLGDPMSPPHLLSPPNFPHVSNPSPNALPPSPPDVVELKPTFVSLVPFQDGVDQIADSPDRHGRRSPGFSIPHTISVYSESPPESTVAASTWMWLEISRAITYAFLHLSPVDPLGEETSDFGSFVRCAGKVCTVSPVLRQYILTRVVHKWPRRNSIHISVLLGLISQAVKNVTTSELPLPLLNRVVRIVVNCMSSTSVSVALRALNMCSWDVRSPSHSSRNASPDPGLSEDSIARVSQMARGISRTNSIAGGHGVLWTLCRDAPSLRRLIREGVQRIATQHWHPSVRNAAVVAVATMPHLSPLPERSSADSKSPSLPDNISCAETKTDSWYGANHHYRSTESLSSAKSPVGTPTAKSSLISVHKGIQVFEQPRDALPQRTPSPPCEKPEESEVLSPSSMGTVTLNLSVVHP